MKHRQIRKSCEEKKGGREEYRKISKTTVGEYSALGPPAMQSENTCCVSFGACVPFMIRRSGLAYKLAGDGYMNGIISGDVVAGALKQRQMGSSHERLDI